MNVLVSAQVGDVSGLDHGACHHLLENDDLWEREGLGYEVCPGTMRESHGMELKGKGLENRVKGTRTNLTPRKRVNFCPLLIDQRLQGSNLVPGRAEIERKSQGEGKEACRVLTWLIPLFSQAPGR